jgi:hypothetical protein
MTRLVTFADTNDPTSVMLVDPNNLSATLGPGVSWRSMTLEATDAAGEHVAKRKEARS